MDGLRGKSGDEIKADVREPGAAEISERAVCVGDSVTTVETAQFRIVESLRAEARAVDARLAKASQSFGRDCAGVHLHRYFGARGHAEAAAHRPQDVCYLLGREQARRPTAEIDRVGLGAFLSPTERTYLRDERADIGVGQRAFISPGREVAVGAARAAERNVDVDTGSFHHGSCRIITRAGDRAALCALAHSRDEVDNPELYYFVRRVYDFAETRCVAALSLVDTRVEKHS